MNRFNRVAKTEGLISFAVTSSLFSHKQKNAFFITDSSNFPQILIKEKLQQPFLIGIFFRYNEPKRCRQNGKHCEH